MTRDNVIRVNRNENVIDGPDTSLNLNSGNEIFYREGLTCSSSGLEMLYFILP